MRVLAVAAQGLQSPSFRVRVSLLQAPLMAYGVTLDAHPLLSAAEEAEFRSTPGLRTRAKILIGARRRMRAALTGFGGDGILIQRQIDMLPTLGLERQAARSGRLVFDVDDAIWHDTSRSAGGSALSWLKGSRRSAAWLAMHSDAIIAGNEVLAEWLTDHGGSVSVIPSLVDVGSSPRVVHSERQEIVLGWIGSPTTATYLSSLEKSIRLAREQLRGQCGLRLIVMGAGANQLASVAAEHEPWSEAAERILLQRMDIGLMPLPDTSWARGKCAYKALQYMAAEVPVIADDVGISASTIGDRAAGLIASGVEEWAEAIVALATDHKLRARLGAEGRKRVTQGFSTERWMPEIAQTLKGLP